MCGIFFSCHRGRPELPDDNLTELLRRRGPDSLHVIQRTATSAPPSLDVDTQTNHLAFVSSVLSLRGCNIVTQPLVDESSNSLLCWNGEAWRLNNQGIYENDAHAVFEILLQASPRLSNDSNILPLYEESLRNVVSAISCISGPYAFVFYDAKYRRVFFGRDSLGRRSLLIRKQANRGITIASVCDGSISGDWAEVEADGIYMLDLDTNARLVNGAVHQIDISEQDPFKVENIPWVSVSIKTMLRITLESPFPNVNHATCATSPPALQLGSEAVRNLEERLKSSLALRVKDIPAPPIENGGRTRIAILFSGGLDCTLLARMIHDISPLDQDIDLLNIAFENPRVIAAAKANSGQGPNTAVGNEQSYKLCPDRLTGLSSHAELLRICPGRQWRFVSINIPYTETIAHRAQVISLIHPHSTEMDLSIAYALYFAARGVGLIPDSETNTLKPYTSPARVLLSGLGADELFGGYTRHATAFARKGYTGLLAELQLDFSRLGKRNLGRDDRVISHWGKEVRYPYLDEDLVTWALERPVWEKCSFEQARSLTTKMASGREHVAPVLEPGKHVLRLLAWKLGMKGAAMEKKRAIQFGARTAKMEAGRTKGTQLLSS